MELLNRLVILCLPVGNMGGNILNFWMVKNLFILSSHLIGIYLGTKYWVENISLQDIEALLDLLSASTFVIEKPNAVGISNPLYRIWFFSPVKFFFFFFRLFFSLRAAPMAYGSSQVKGQIRATIASLGHSHSNTNPSLICNLRHSLGQCPDP